MGSGLKQVIAESYLFLISRNNAELHGKSLSTVFMRLKFSSFAVLCGFSREEWMLLNYRCKHPTVWTKKLDIKDGWASRQHDDTKHTPKSTMDIFKRYKLGVWLLAFRVAQSKYCWKSVEGHQKNSACRAAKDSNREAFSSRMGESLLSKDWKNLSLWKPALAGRDACQRGCKVLTVQPFSP